MNKLIFFASIAFAITTSSCKKDKDTTPPPDLSPPNQTTLADFFKAHISAAQTFTVDASVASSFLANQGTKVNVPAMAFMTKQGAIITGNVVLSVTEIYSRKDIVLNKSQTMTSTELLNSGGELKITSSQNGQELKLYPGKQLVFEMPAGTQPSYSMQVYYGATNFTNSTLYWVQTGSVAVSAPPVSNTVNVINPYYYVFPSDSVNWVHCAALAVSPNQKTPVTITTHGNYNATNTNIFLLFPTFRCITLLNGADQVYNGYQLPIGTNMTIVAISKIAGNFYASYTNTTVVNNHNQDLNLSQTTEADILAKLATY